MLFQKLQRPDPPLFRGCGIANALHDSIVQRWFHSHPRVQATELLLQEKPVGRSTAHMKGAKAA